MKIIDVQWTPFRVPFRRQFATASRMLDHRTGVLLHLHTEDGIIGLGEASPLPASGQDLWQDTLAVFIPLKQLLIGRQITELEDVGKTLREASPGPHHTLAAACCALDTAVCDAQAQSAGITVAKLLSSHPAHSVVVNATIGSAATEVAYQSALDARAAGFSCVKLKVGIADSIGAEAERVAAVREAIGPDIALRLDANGAWKVAQAIRAIQALEQYKLEFVEQPVPAADVLGLRRVREAISTLIAADESIIDYESAQSVLAQEAAQVFVIKPMVVGGLRRARRIIELANAANVAVIVTTTIDTGVGNAAALHLAATLPLGSPACGLATGDLLATDLLTCPLTVSAGRMALPARAGLGISLDLATLAQYRFTNASRSRVES